MGYTKKLAYEKASSLECEIIEIKTKEKINNILGFWWCGRFGLHAWPMSIEEVKIDLSKYQIVHLYSPTWVFKMCGPIRELLKQKTTEINKVNFTLVHFMSSHINGAYKEVKTILGDKLIDFEEYTSHYGITKKLSSRKKKQ